MGDPLSLHILQHALGLDEHGQGRAYRNHYVTGPECDSWAACMAHTEAGRMVRHEPRPLFGAGEHHCFEVTEAGRAFVREHSPPCPKRTRAQARYRAWLDADSELTFGEWVRGGDRG